MSTSLWLLNTTWRLFPCFFIIILYYNTEQYIVYIWFISHTPPIIFFPLPPPVYSMIEWKLPSKLFILAFKFLLYALLKASRKATNKCFYMYVLLTINVLHCFKYPYFLHTKSQNRTMPTWQISWPTPPSTPTPALTLFKDRSKYLLSKCSPTPNYRSSSLYSRSCKWHEHCPS